MYADASSNPFPNSTFIFNQGGRGVYRGPTQAATAPTGFTFAPAEKSSSKTLQNGGSTSRSGTLIGPTPNTGGVTGDSFTFPRQQRVHHELECQEGTLLLVSTASAAVAKAALSIQVNEVTNAA